MSRLKSLPSGLKTGASVSLFVITVIALYCLSGCGKSGGGSTGGTTGNATPITVSVTALSTTVNGSATVKVTATVSNDSSNSGVTWTTPASGSLSSLTAASTTYTAPASTSAAQSVTLTATSVADKTKSGSVTLTIDPSIGVSVTPLSTTIDGADTTTLTAAVTNDASNAGVTWSAPSAGSLSSSTAASPTYAAPGATGSQQTVTLTATSVADTTKSGSVTVTIPAQPEILTGSLPLFIPGAAISTTLVGSGGIAPYKWMLTSGTLPTGVSLNATTGMLSAAAGSTTATPATSLTFQLTDSGTPTALTATATLSLTINAPSISGTVSFGSTAASSNPAPAFSISAQKTALSVRAAASSSPAVSLPTVQVSINTPTPQTVPTDSNGNFSFESVPNGTYTITPSLANAIFTPATQSITVNNNAPQASFKAAVGYSISGTVNYSGAATGPIYLVARGDGGTPMQGTSVLSLTGSSATFTINGVGPGNYTIVAWRDALGNGVTNASDPAGSATADIGATGNLTSVSVTLTDPAPVVFNSALNPTLTVTPFDQGVVVSAQSLLDIFDSTSTFNDLGVTAEVATSYKVQWCADSACATLVGNKMFPATIGQGTNTWFVSGLSDSTAYYFRYQGVAGSATSSWSPVVGPVTPGQPAGSVTVSGNVTLPAASTYPLYIAFQNQASNTPYYMRIANPAASTPYSIQLPPGTYEYSAFVDQNNMGVEVNGDMQTAPAPSLPVLTVPDSTVTQNMTVINGGLSYVTWTTNNAQTFGASSSSTQQYSISFQAIDGTEHLVGAQLQQGPNAITFQDIPRSFENSVYSFNSSINLYGTPKTNDSYSLVLTYSNGATQTQTLNEELTGVVGDFGANPSPAGVGTNLTPNFTWTNPTIADSFGYNYFILEPISLPSGDPYVYWGGDLPTNVDSITWGTNPFAGSTPPASLVEGGEYRWVVAAEDSNGNTSNMTVSYDPGYTGVWLPLTNPSTLAATAKVGQSYSGTVTASGGKGPYTYTVFGPGNGLSSSISGGTVTISGTPLVAGLITFEVNVEDNSGTFWWAIYTINVGS